MIRIGWVLALALCGASPGGPAMAQGAGAADDTPDEQRIADAFRAEGSACGAPACRNDPDGVYPPSTAPGIRSISPSIPAAGTSGRENGPKGAYPRAGGADIRSTSPSIPGAGTSGSERE